MESSRIAQRPPAALAVTPPPMAAARQARRLPLAAATPACSHSTASPLHRDTLLTECAADTGQRGRRVPAARRPAARHLQLRLGPAHAAARAQAAGGRAHHRRVPGRVHHLGQGALPLLQQCLLRKESKWRGNPADRRWLGAGLRRATIDLLHTCRCPPIPARPCALPTTAPPAAGRCGGRLLCGPLLAVAQRDVPAPRPPRAQPRPARRHLGALRGLLRQSAAGV